jgi:hypothetical protein
MPMTWGQVQIGLEFLVDMLFRAGLCVHLKKKKKNHSTQDSRVVPHRGTNWAALWLTAQIERDAVLSESYGRG